MSLGDLLKKGCLRRLATATPATFATHGIFGHPTVATVAVAKAPGSEFNEQTSELTADWRELAQAYHRHHFECPKCISCGRSGRYGFRCGLGFALWEAYQVV
jgi:hypothetical protein